MNIVEWRLAQAEKRADEMDARTKNIEQTLTEIRLSLATLATRDFMRNWALSLAAIIVATGVGLGAMLLQSSANQLSAFQAGLSAVQAASAVQGASAAKPSGH